ncbi:MAG: glutamate-ammonia-ligase adenylyltransferase [bacterium]|nr:glutamate-ammonia-ligase adenylyltransferase [bacterium]
MKPTCEQLCSLCPAVEPAFVAAHLACMEPDYFACFSTPQIAAHVSALASLAPGTPVTLLVEARRDDTLECTILAFDYPYEFSLITGILAGVGFSIRAGDVFTSRANEAAPQTRRRIVDRFIGTRADARNPREWQAGLQATLRAVIGILEHGDAEALSQARAHVNELVARWLARAKVDARAALFPVRITIDNALSGVTRLCVVAQDTPAFLYTLTNALALQSVRIERVVIRTTDGRIEDQIDVTDARGGKISDDEALNQIKLSVLLTKQFTYFLTQAPDPYAALARFEQLVGAVLRAPSRGQWLDVLSNPHALQDLARLLGASDFLWEDFVRQQYETLLPMLAPQVEGRRFSKPLDTLARDLQESLARATSLTEQRELLNTFKDREIFLTDLDQILDADHDFRPFAERLTGLAELVVRAACAMAHAHLVAKYGVPRTAAGAPAQYAIFGLGKFGGAALGYASDIELLFVYSDNGETDGAVRTSNADFFHRLAQEATLSIRAKREGIFHVDLRLRPYGNASPLASSLENFCNYYGPGGPALAYERLALVRLRPITGDAALGARVARVRDEFVYQAAAINPAEVLALRRKQCAELARGTQPNVKFSSGGLVDVEYDVQMLQVLHGHTTPAVRTPRIHAALEALAQAGILNPDESTRLLTAYDFLRRLINAMRMLRGSAKDLLLPAPAADEYAHLARRMGYAETEALSAAQRLHLDFETHTAVVRAFVEHHFGRAALARPHSGTVADLILSEAVPPDAQAVILHQAGFQDAARAYRNLRAVAGTGTQREQFARLAILACDMLRTLPDADMALNNWEHFVAAVPDRAAHFSQLLSQPARLEILLAIFAGSQFLADTLMHMPELFDWVTTPEVVRTPRRRAELDAELHEAMAHAATPDAWRACLRRIRRRELLRIGTRDLWLHVPLEDTTHELSLVAEALTGAALVYRWRLTDTVVPAGQIDEPARHLCLLAFGKLGGDELNYSSDIDLLGLCDDCAFTVQTRAGEEWSHKQLYQRVLDGVRQDLSDMTPDGFAYRVDFRLRPHGSAGEWAPSVSAAIDYYRTTARLWELQATLKLRPIAGALPIGEYFLGMLRQCLVAAHDPGQVRAGIAHLRALAVQKSTAGLRAGVDVKNGIGGIRDIEFCVQGLQLMHAGHTPQVLHHTTLSALRLLQEQGVLDAAVAHQLAEDYRWLRRVEHFLQILEDQQIHAVPLDGPAVAALAQRVCSDATSATQFLQQLDATMARVKHDTQAGLAPEHQI